MGSRLAAATTAAVSSTVSQVVEGVMRMFWIKKATAASLAVCAVFSLGVGVGMSGRMVEGVAGGQEKTPIKPEGPSSPEHLRSLENEITDTEKRLARAKEVWQHAQSGVEHVERKIKLAEESGNYPPDQKLDDLITLARFESSRDDATAEARVLLARLNLLLASKAQAAKPVPRPDEPKSDLEIIDRRLAQLRERWETSEAEAQKLKNDAELAARRYELLAAERKAIDDAVQELVKRRAALMKNQPAAAAKTGGYLELRISGTAAMYQFSLQEFDAAGKEIGTVAFTDSMKHPAMLAKVLARTRTDSTAPTEVRVLASPPTALGGGPVAALKACDAAGYKTIKFTGYVVAGGFAQELKIGDRGVRPGYAWYDGVERKITELLKEIEDGLRTF